jgi:hypothetical protein
MLFFDGQSSVINLMDEEHTTFCAGSSQRQRKVNMAVDQSLKSVDLWKQSNEEELK